jgi:NADH-quinone oxidoreductase subunit E
MALEFSDRERREIAALVERYPEGKQGAALLPVLHLAQARFGHLSSEVQLLVANTLGVHPARVHEVVTFYEMYHEHPEGQFHLEVCTNISCHLCGGDAILDHLKHRLGIRPGQVTEDGLFSLMEAECLASCGSGPMMKVGLDYYEFLTIEAVDQLLGRFREIAPRLEGKAYERAPEGPHVGPVPGCEPVLPSIGAAPTPAPRAPVGEPPDPAGQERVDAEAGAFEAEAEREAEELANGEADPETHRNERVAKEVADEARRSEEKAKGGEDA